MVKKVINKMKVLRMGLPIVENLSGLQESIFSLLTHHNSILVNKHNKIAGWEEERSGPTGKSFRFVRACVRAVIVKWE